MNIVCVAACTAGIAHTYIAREKLIKGAKALGHTIKVETQGTIGTENELQAADISAADVVILAVDVKIKGEERFTGNDSNLLIVFYVQIMPDDFVMQLHRF